MRFTASLDVDGGEYVATCSEMGVSAHGPSPTNALDALRAEIRYRVELCPCSRAGDDWVELELAQ
jgi:hypothetical protein